MKRDLDASTKYIIFGIHESLGIESTGTCPRFKIIRDKQQYTYNISGGGRISRKYPKCYQWCNYTICAPLKRILVSLNIKKIYNKLMININFDT